MHRLADILHPNVVADGEKQICELIGGKDLLHFCCQRVVNGTLSCNQLASVELSFFESQQLLRIRLQIFFGL